MAAQVGYFPLPKQYANVSQPSATDGLLTQLAQTMSGNGTYNYGPAMLQAMALAGPSPALQHPTITPAPLPPGPAPSPGATGTSGGLGGALSTILGSSNSLSDLVSKLQSLLGGGPSQSDVNGISQSTDQAVNSQLGSVPPITLPPVSVDPSPAPSAPDASGSYVDTGSITPVPGALGAGAVGGGLLGDTGPTGVISVDQGSITPVPQDSPTSATPVSSIAPAAGVGAVTGGLVGGTAAPAGAITVTDMAGNVLAGGGSELAAPVLSGSSSGGEAAGSIAGGAVNSLPAGAAAAAAAIIAADIAGLYGADQAKNSIRRADTNEQSRYSLAQYLQQLDSLQAAAASGKGLNGPDTPDSYKGYFQLPDISSAAFRNLPIDQQQAIADKWMNDTGNAFVIGQVKDGTFSSVGGNPMAMTPAMQQYNQYQMLQNSFQTPQPGTPEYDALMQTVMGPNYGG